MTVLLHSPVVSGRVLEFLDVRCAGRLACCSTDLLRAVDENDAFWAFQAAKAEGNTAPAPKRARRSTRHQTSAKDTCRRSFMTRVGRAEIFVLRLSGLLSSGRLSVPNVRTLMKELEPLDIGHYFNTLESSALLEVAKARKVREQKIVAVVKMFLNTAAPGKFPVDQCAQDGMTALCLASARGLPNVAKTLIEAGASQDIEGQGCFMSPSQKRINGSFTPIGWVQHMIAIVSAHENKQEEHNELLRNYRKCEKILNAKTHVAASIVASTSPRNST